MISVSSTYDSVPLSRISPPTTPPPLTPTVTAADKPISHQQPSPALSDDSIFELSFNYERNAAGEWVRVSKGSGKSSPPSSSSEHPSPLSSESPRLESPVPFTSAGRRSSLSRSESEPLIDTAIPSGRTSFQRVTSGPLALGPTSTPATSSSRIALLSSATGTGRKVIGGARRVKLEDVKEANERVRSDIEEPKQRELKMQLPGKENAEVSLYPSSFTLPSAQPLSEVNPAPQRSLSVQGRQVLPVPTRRLAKKIETISETEDDSEADRLASSAGIRPRRSASLSEAHDGLAQPPHFQQFPRMAAGATRGARRVTIEEKLRQERDIALEEGYARREAEEAADAARRAASEFQAGHPAYNRQSPSPPHLPSHVRPGIHHQRRDSDTLKSMAPSMVTSTSPTLAEALPARRSPSNLGYSSSAAPNARHRRSPTAPEPPTTSGMIAPPGLSANAMGKTWAAGDAQDGESEYNNEEFAPLPTKGAPAMLPPPVPMQKTQSAPAPKPAAQGATAGGRNFIINKKVYARLDMIGKGGSSRVFRVLSAANELCAVKRVSLDRTDAETMSGYMNEIALLKRLDGNQRIIRLIDSEVRGGPGGSKGYLMLVMECGEIDLAKLLQEQQREPLDIVWVSYYFKQMLQAVHVIHEEKIVHSDLKPANFVLVRGQVKLIDFGIANAIANDTTNIQRDAQIGTVNYMSPEAIEIPDGMRRHKVGRASDVWSLGCILYQMVYGQPPFQHLSLYQRMKVIPDGSYPIDFPEFSTPSVPRTSGSSSPPKKLEHIKVPVPAGVIDTIKMCMTRNPKERATIPELLVRDWLATGAGAGASTAATPPAPAPALKEDETVINPYFMQQLLRYGISLGESGKRMSEDDLVKEAERLVAELKGVHATSHDQT